MHVSSCLCGVGNWRKLCSRVPEHENSTGHWECYLASRELERCLSLQECVENLIETSLNVESEKWHTLKRIIDVTIFIGERGIAFLGSSQSIGD